MSEQQKSYFTIEEMVSLPSFFGIAVRPDGAGLAYVARKSDWDENHYLDQVFTYDSETHQHSCVTPDGNGGSSPQWSPVGDCLAYLRSVGEGDQRKLQIFVRSAAETTGVQLTDVLEGVSFYRFSPDGKQIYYASPMPQPEREARKQAFGDIEYVDVDDQRRTLYVVDVAAARQDSEQRFQQPKDLRQHVAGAGDGATSDAVPRDVTDPAPVVAAKPLFQRSDLHVLDFDITPDGAGILFTAAPSTNFEDIDKQGLYRLCIASRTVEQLAVAGPIGSTVLVSADGLYCLFTRQTGDGLMFRNLALDVCELATGQVKTIPLDIDENVYPVAWTERGIFVEWQNRTSPTIELVQPSGLRETLVADPKAMVRGVSVTRDGRDGAWLQATTDAPWDVYLNGERVTQLHEAYAAKQTSTKQVMHWLASDDVEIEGVLSLPQDFAAGKTYPLLVVIHGGPTAASLPTPTAGKYYPIEQFIEQGFIVLEPNYRGSTGYGDRFRGLNERNLGLGDYDDVISGVDALIESGYADAERVGVMGWSQGGYISAFCTTYSHRFKAVSVGAGISNWVTYYVSTDIHPFTRHYLGATPWNDPDVYAKTSPMTYIKNANTPTLIQHGDNDTRVPVPNAFELYQGLRDVGVEVKLVLFKGMQHGSNKPAWNRAIMHQNFAWFTHYILGEPIAGFWLK